jgi:hypothetical protein
LLWRTLLATALHGVSGLSSALDAAKGLQIKSTFDDRPSTMIVDDATKKNNAACYI